MTEPARAVFATRDTVPHTAERGIETALLLEPRDTAGRSAAREIVCAPDAAVAIDGRDAHRYVFVVTGTWTMTVGDDRRACAADTMIQLPAGVAAHARVTGDATGKLLVVTLPVRDGALQPVA